MELNNMELLFYEGEGFFWVNKNNFVNLDFNFEWFNTRWKPIFKKSKIILRNSVITLSIVFSTFNSPSLAMEKNKNYSITKIISESEPIQKKDFNYRLKLLKRLIVRKKRLFISLVSLTLFMTIGTKIYFAKPIVSDIKPLKTESNYKNLTITKLNNKSIAVQQPSEAVQLTRLNLVLLDLLHNDIKNNVVKNNVIKNKNKLFLNKDLESIQNLNKTKFGKQRR